MEQTIVDLNKKIESLTKAKVDGDVEQGLRNVLKAVARAPESIDLEILVDAARPQGRTELRVVPQGP